MLDNYNLYIRHETEQKRQYEQFRQAYEDGELTEEEWQEIKEMEEWE